MALLIIFGIGLEYLETPTLLGRLYVRLLSGPGITMVYHLTPILLGRSCVLAPVRTGIGELYLVILLGEIIKIDIIFYKISIIKQSFLNNTQVVFNHNSSLKGK